jgi:AraC-like DNA-binding protein
MEFWNYPRSPAGALILVEFAGRHGISAAQMLEGSRLTQGELRAPDIEIAAAQELRVLTNLVKALGDPVRLGVEVGQEFHFATYGIWGLALVSRATGRDAIQFAMRFLPLTHAFTAISFQEHADRGVLSFAEPDLPAEVRDFIVARDMVAAALLMRENLGEDPGLLHFDLKAPSRDPAAAPLPSVFSTPITCGAAANRIVIARTYLDRPLPQANPVTAAMAETLCRQRVEQQRRGLKTGAISHRFRSTYSDSAPGSLTAFARLANMSERTLKRRLQAEGTSFRALAAEGRRAQAEALLEDDTLTIGEIAEQLGFSDLSSFSQAFKRWTGLAPSSFRSRARETVSGD